MSIYFKIQQCRVELQNMKLKKSGKNKFAGFEYFELADFLPAINSLFLKYKLFSNFSIENEQAYLIIYDAENETTNITFTSPIADLELKGCTAIQALGGIHTYMKRYLYLNALEIVENDMLDAQAGNLNIDEAKIYKEIEASKDLKTLNSIFKKYESIVVDREKFKSACTKKKGEFTNV